MYVHIPGLGNKIPCFGSSSRITKWSMGREYPQREGESYLMKGERMHAGSTETQKNGLYSPTQKWGQFNMYLIHFLEETQNIYRSYQFHLINLLKKQESCIIGFTFYHGGKIQNTQSLNDLFKIIHVSMVSKLCVQMSKPGNLLC